MLGVSSVIRPITPKLLAADIEHRPGDDEPYKVGLGGDIHVGRQQGEVDALGEAGEGFGAVIEFVITHRHGIKAEAVHHLGGGLTAIVGKK